MAGSLSSDPFGLVEMFASYLSKTLTAQTGIDIKFQKVKGSWKEGMEYLLICLIYPSL